MLHLSKEGFQKFYQLTGIQISEEEEETINEQLQKENVGSLSKEQSKKYKDVYKRYYDVFLKGSQHNLEEDYAYAFHIRNMLQALYVLKDNSLEFLIKSLSMADKNKLNFGIIKEEQKKKNEYGENQVLFGIDLENTPPICNHGNTGRFYPAVKKYFGDKDFSMYLRPDDLQVGATYMTTPLAYRFTKGAKQYISDYMKTVDETSPLYPLMRHLFWNIHINQNPLNSKKEEVKALGPKKSRESGQPKSSKRNQPSVLDD